jgi:hypothetical protein
LFHVEIVICAGPKTVVSDSGFGGSASGRELQLNRLLGEVKGVSIECRVSLEHEMDVSLSGFH